MYRVESSSKNLQATWAWAIVCTALRILIGMHDEPPIFLRVILLFSWIAVAEAYSSIALLKMIQRKGADETL